MGLTSEELTQQHARLAWNAGGKKIAWDLHQEIQGQSDICTDEANAAEEAFDAASCRHAARAASKNEIQLRNQAVVLEDRATDGYVDALESSGVNLSAEYCINWKTGDVHFRDDVAPHSGCSGFPTPETDSPEFMFAGGPELPADDQPVEAEVEVTGLEAAEQDEPEPEAIESFLGRAMQEPDPEVAEVHGMKAAAEICEEAHGKIDTMMQYLGDMRNKLNDALQRQVDEEREECADAEVELNHHYTVLCECGAVIPEREERGECAECESPCSKKVDFCEGCDHLHTVTKLNEPFVRDPDCIITPDAQLGQELEGIIAMRTHFTGEEPYVGNAGVILALNEALNERDALRRVDARVREALLSVDDIAGESRIKDAHWAPATFRYIAKGSCPSGPEDLLKDAPLPSASCELSEMGEDDPCSCGYCCEDRRVKFEIDRPDPALDEPCIQCDGHRDIVSSDLCRSCRVEVLASTEHQLQTFQETEKQFAAEDALGKAAQNLFTEFLNMLPWWRR